MSAFSALMYGWSDYMGGRAARHVPVLRVMINMEYLLAATYLTLVIADPAPVTWLDLMWGAFAGVGGVGGLAAFYLASTKGPVSLASAVTGVASTIAPVIAGLVLGERPSGAAMVGIVLAMVSVVLVSGAVSSRRESVAMPRQQVWLVLLAGALFGLWYISLDQASDESGWWPLLGARILAIPAFVVLAWRRRGKDLSSPEQRRSGWRLTVGAWATVVFANVSYLVAVRDGMLSIVAVVVSMYPAGTIMLAIIFDRERLSKSQWGGVALAASALVLVGVGA